MYLMTSFVVLSVKHFELHEAVQMFYKPKQTLTQITPCSELFLDFYSSPSLQISVPCAR